MGHALDRLPAAVIDRVQDDVGGRQAGRDEEGPQLAEKHRSHLGVPRDLCFGVCQDVLPVCFNQRIEAWGRAGMLWVERGASA